MHHPQTRPDLSPPYYVITSSKLSSLYAIIPPTPSNFLQISLSLCLSHLDLCKFRHIILFQIPSPKTIESMASSSPAILPISNPQTTTTTAQSQPPIATPAFRAFLSNITDNVRNGFSQRRPWYELVDRSAFSKPDSLSDATHRIRKNYSYFRVNYLSCLAAVLAISLLTNPFALIALLALLAAWIFLYLFRPSDSPLVILGRAFSETETLGLLIVSTVVVIFLTSVGSVLISALMVGLAIICAHGAFRAPEDLFLDEPEGATTTGFLSFLSAPASNPVTARV